MSKRKTYIINLIFHGYLVEDLYFGPFCHNWWIVRPSEKNHDPCFLFPIRLQFKILIVLNEHDFIIEVGQLDSQFGPHPSYICKCDGVQRPEIMDYDTPEIVQEYLNELPF
ncbi:5236_t:CDS:2 [Cetraspora pellucida]|uniref:5236_t:CDS:1 n=1 Tax=Cetraspora pellucida TaxID=1433469 RepID=A0ACA9KSZ7_9GLOM|nr:5236_t:CDS:2 [Cetraspora pellucida]